MEKFIGARVSSTTKLASIKPISAQFMRRLGVKVQKDVRIRTLKGSGAYGSENNLVEQRHPKGYSEAPAIIPISTPALRKYYRSTLKGGNSRRGMEKGDSKARFVRLPGGYKQYRQIHGRNVARVDHTFTGSMLNSLRVYATNRKISITVPASQLNKAYYTDKLRPWFKMTKREQISAGKTVSKEYVRFYK